MDSSASLSVDEQKGELAAKLNESRTAERNRVSVKSNQRVGPNQHEPASSLSTQDAFDAAARLRIRTNPTAARAFSDYALYNLLRCVS